jgi:nucleoside-diphosphate-sugar epimerase
VYGQSDGEWVDENSPTEPKHFTGKRLLQGEEILLQGGIPTTVVRFGGIYGPARIGLFLGMRHNPAISADDRTKFLNLIHRDDCIGALAHLVSLETPASIYLATDGNPVQRSEIKQWLSDRWTEQPDSPATPSLRTRRRGQSNKRCSNSRLLATGYRFVYPSFRKGLESI